MISILQNEFGFTENSKFLEYENEPFVSIFTYFLGGYFHLYQASLIYLRILLIPVVT